MLEKISIINYSLYRCPLEISFSSKLNIIYGTNGTGKSTLLMLCLFSIIGPYRGGIKTKVRQERRRDNRPIYSDSFFSDRMLETGEEPIIKSYFTINQDKYVVEHSLKDGRLVSAEVNGTRLPGKVITYKTYEGKYTQNRSNDSAEDNLEDYLIFHYQQQIKQSTQLPGGVNTLINMLLDVMFFDEGRKLTFWNTDLQETIIGKYIVDAVFYEQYCEKKLTTKALESAYKKKSETYNFMHKFFQKEMEENNEGRPQKDAKLHDELSLLFEKVQKQEQLLAEDQKLYKRKNNDFLNMVREEEKAKESLDALENLWYKNLFPNQYEKYHKQFSKKMMEGICPLCESEHSFLLSTDRCIMCGETITLNVSQDIVSIDIARQKTMKCISEIIKKKEDYTEELSEISKRIEKTRKEINTANIRINEIKALLQPDDDHRAESDRKRLEKAISERDEALSAYNSSRKEEEFMKKRIEESLVDNFTEFRRNFLRYSSSFFGENHSQNISLPFSQDEISSAPLMKFELDGRVRDEEYMLSESQRIFTDLSFRFSILTTFHNRSFFICETPDSTLDKYHEELAVKTFEEYIDRGNALFISANARYSSLVYKLFYQYGLDNVTVIDLTQLSKLALPNNYSFDSYIKEQ